MLSFYRSDNMQHEHDRAIRCTFSVDFKEIKTM